MTLPVYLYSMGYTTVTFVTLRWGIITLQMWLLEARPTRSRLNASLINLAWNIMNSGDGSVKSRVAADV